MGEQISPKYDFGFELPEEGVHVVVVGEPKTSIYDCRDKDGQTHGKGYQFSVKCMVEGGPSDGLYHFESWRSRWGDGNINSKALSALYGFLVKIGVKKEGGIDSDEIESDKFCKGFETIAGKSLGIDIFHSKGKDDKVWSRSKGYYTVAEAKAKMGKGAASNPAPSAPKQDKEGW